MKHQYCFHVFLLLALTSRWVSSWQQSQPPAFHRPLGRQNSEYSKHDICLSANSFEGDEAASYNLAPPPIRLNKVFKATHSRREADRIIQDGRVEVNGEISFGDMVVPYQDTISLDGMAVQGWEQMNGILASQESTRKASNNSNNQGDRDDTIRNFEYTKYYKPRGVICTTDQRVQGNIIDALMDESGYRPRHRVYPVGRLDKDSSGLILLTSDGRLPNASLRRQQKQPKVYQVKVNQRLSEDALEMLRSGIEITTVAQRDGKSKPLTAKTKPCVVTPLGPRHVEIILEEGRNRQIRKMMAVLGYEVQELHRIGFGEIALDHDMAPGDWKDLINEELEWIESILETDL